MGIFPEKVQASSGVGGRGMVEIEVARSDFSSRCVETAPVGRLINAANRVMKSNNSWIHDHLVGGFNPSENISQIGSFPQIGTKIKNI